VREGYLRGSLPRTPTARQVDVLAAFVAAGGSVADPAARVGVRPSTAKRHLTDLRARSGLTTEQLIYRGRAEGWLVAATLEATNASLVPGVARESVAASSAPQKPRTSWTVDAGSSNGTR
jgi:hypothetical protein